MNRYPSFIRLLVSLIIIAFGVGLLLQAAGVLPQPFIDYAKSYGWACLLLAIGIRQLFAAFQRLRRFGRIQILQFSFVSGLLLLFWGACLLLNQLGYSAFTFNRFLNLVWPVLLILLGISFLFRGSIWEPFYRHYSRNWWTPEVEKAPPPFNGLNLRTSRKRKHKHFLIGELRLGGPESWVYEDISVSNLLGEVRVDLSQAILSQPEHHLLIRGLAGEVQVTVPPALPVRVYAHVHVGSVRIFSEKHDGFGRALTYQTPGYEAAERKLDIYIELKAGEIRVAKS